MKNKLEVLQLQIRLGTTEGIERIDPGFHDELFQLVRNFLETKQIKISEILASFKKDEDYKGYPERPIKRS